MIHAKKIIHFVGIKGVGMTPLAIIAKQAGHIVTGCDVDQQYITDENLKAVDITPLKQFSANHLTDVDLVITTGAHNGYDNPEVQAALKNHIPVMTQGQAVGFFMTGELFHRTDILGISIAGCHGKTTTTAMIAHILRDAGKDPSFVIGTGNIPSLGNSGYYGKGRYFIAEADEYATEPIHDKTPKLLWQHPQYAIITNIEFDHPDLYPSIVQVREAYRAFITQMSSSATLIICGDDENIKKIQGSFKGKIITYGFQPDNNYILKRVLSKGKEIHVQFEVKGEKQTVDVGVPGEHNGLNSLAAFILAREIGIDEKTIRESLMHFIGTKRRLEYIGKLATGAEVYDDYAHHPTEIQKSLSALNSAYPKKRIVCIFQPHTFSRTKELFDQFKYSFKLADEVILTNIYASQREKPDATISSEMLAHAVKKTSHPKVVYLPNLSDVVQYVEQNAYDSRTIIVTMGAGDVYTILPDLLKV